MRLGFILSYAVAGTGLAGYWLYPTNRGVLLLTMSIWLLIARVFVAKRNQVRYTHDPLAYDSS